MRLGADDAVDSQDPVAIAAVRAIGSGDTESLASLLGPYSGLASEQIHGTRTPLHVAADWPGYCPAGPATGRLLIEAGTDPNAVVTDGTQAETPLHCGCLAASRRCDTCRLCPRGS